MFWKKKMVSFWLGILILFSWVFFLTIPVGAAVSRDAISFSDPAVERAVRAKLIKFEGELYPEDVAAIEELNLSSKGISDLEGLQYLTGLKKLSLSLNRISDISPLKDLINLEDLTIMFNRVKSVEPLSGLKNLDMLNACGNDIMDIKPLASLKKLHMLDLSMNEIDDISPLKNLTNLYDLVLDHNQIRDIGPLRGLSGLGWLRLSNNRIEEIDALKNLSQLRLLQLSKNQIQDFSPVAAYFDNLAEKDFTLSERQEKVIITVLLAGIPVDFDVRPVNIDGRVLVPFRNIFEALGAEVDWEETIRTVTAKKGRTTVSLTINSKIALVNGEERELDVPAKLIDNRTLVPVRFITESLGGSIDYNPKTRTVSIMPKPAVVLPQITLDEQAISEAFAPAGIMAGYKIQRRFTAEDTGEIQLHESLSFNGIQSGSKDSTFIVEAGKTYLFTRIIALMGSVDGYSNGNEAVYALTSPSFDGVWEVNINNQLLNNDLEEKPHIIKVQ